MKVVPDLVIRKAKVFPAVLWETFPYFSLVRTGSPSLHPAARGS